jgi:tetratricopeptide (TPR) repeat protein
MLEPHTASVLVDYYEAFLKDKNIDAFRKNVQDRYNEGTLCRLAQSGASQAKRAAVLALGLVGTFNANDAVGRSMGDADPVVRSLAQNGLWAIWFRADSADNNDRLQEVAGLLGQSRHEDAVKKATALIARSPRFAEAYNQRAIALFFQKKFDESAADCTKALELNPYHFGALGGLVQCQLALGKRFEALKTCRRALKIQPYSESLREAVESLEAEGA